MNRITASILSALALVALTSCDNQPSRPNYQMGIQVGPRDFATGLTNSALVAVSWIGSVDPTTAAEADAYFPEHFRVYSITTGQRIAGDVRIGFWSIDGAELSEPLRVPNGQEGYSFVPNAPLPEGWFIAALDLGPWRASGHHFHAANGGGPDVLIEDEVVYVRFQMGSSPVWFETAIRPLDPDGTVLSTVTPTVGAPLLHLTSNPFSLLVDGAVDSRCTELRDDPSGWWYWQCTSLPPEAELEVRLDDVSVVTALAGIRSQTFRADLEAADLRIDDRFGVDVARDMP